MTRKRPDAKIRFKKSVSNDATGVRLDWIGTYEKFTVHIWVWTNDVDNTSAWSWNFYDPSGPRFGDSTGFDTGNAKNHREATRAAFVSFHKWHVGVIENRTQTT